MCYFALVFLERFPPENPDDDFIDKKPPRKAQVAFPHGFTACGDCSHLSPRATRSQHVEEKPSPLLQEPWTAVGLWEHKHPQSRCRCHQDLCWENEQEKSKVLEITKYGRVETKFCCNRDLLHTFTVQLHASIAIRGGNVGIHTHNCWLCLSSRTNIKATRRFHRGVTERARGACNDMDAIMHNSFTIAPHAAHNAHMWAMVAFVEKEIMMVLWATPHCSNQPEIKLCNLREKMQKLY